MADSDLGECVCQWCSKRLNDHSLLKLNECAMRLRLSQMSADEIHRADRKRKEFYRQLAVR